MNAKPDKLFTAARIAWILALLLAAGAISFLEFFIGPKFEQIYRDAIPGVPLPKLTLFITHHPLEITLFYFGLSGLGIWSMGQRRSKETIFVFILLLLQIGMTIYALYSPMDILITGVNSHASSN